MPRYFWVHYGVEFTTTRHHVQSSCTFISLVTSRGFQSTSGEHRQQTSFPLSVQYRDCRNSTVFTLVSVGLCFPTILEKRRLVYFPAHSIKSLTKKSLKSRWEWWPLQEYYKTQLFSFLIRASGKTVFLSTWRCVHSSDVCWPFHRYVRHTPSVYWGVLKDLALRFFFYHRYLSLLADGCSTCKLLFYLSTQLHLTLHWSFLVCHRFSISVFSIWSQVAFLVSSVALSCIHIISSLSRSSKKVGDKKIVHKSFVFYTFNTVW